MERGKIDELPTHIHFSLKKMISCFVAHSSRRHWPSTTKFNIHIYFVFFDMFAKKTLELSMHIRNRKKWQKMCQRFQGVHFVTRVCSVIAMLRFIMMHAGECWRASERLTKFSLSLWLPFSFSSFTFQLRFIAATMCISTANSGMCDALCKFMSRSRTDNTMLLLQSRVQKDRIRNKKL